MGYNPEMPPYPKRKRIVDPELVRKVRELGYCMLSGYGECWGGLDVHHIQSRGSGGDDVEGNLILLCRKHHNVVHNGLISKDKLYVRVEMAKRLHSDETVVQLRTRRPMR